MKKDFFYLSLPKWTGSNILYKIFIDKNGLYASKVGGQFSDPTVIWMILYAIVLVGFVSITKSWIAFIIGLPIVIIMCIYTNKFMKKIMKCREEKEKKIAKVKPGSKKFLSLDKNNFSWTKKEVKHISIKKNSAYAAFWQGASAHIEFSMANGSMKKFVIPAGQDVEHVKKVLIIFSDKIEFY